jgi:hypothetical protein
MPDFIQQLRGRLVKMGCPMARIERLVRELADHCEDLKQAGLAEGLSEADAEARADGAFGDPLVLAEQTMMSVRRSTWWGRHCVITFALLPIFAWVFWTLMLVCEMSLVDWGWDNNKFDPANPITVHHLLLAFRFTDYLGVALVALLFCWLAQRTTVNPRWMVISCVISSMVALICWTNLVLHTSSTSTHSPGTMTYSSTSTMTFSVDATLSTHPAGSWLRAMIPLLVAGAAYAIQRWTIRRHQQRIGLVD